ncbi:hypothetical protein N7532_012088 [Penicillium argentinense]|uniref:Zn(2)-C6 fungal-type domain-containing protein n=1 Tax=Penicillium argentinense TaxID=1131581 RepID=A0A9W9EJU5_9EURO|nr:uncharacterized protein N7532_012088 [Penicillium argentinense]KAJ5083045.1 hypothetical protein N7532_012088 [Penicillium argentinense]
MPNFRTGTYGRYCQCRPASYLSRRLTSTPGDLLLRHRRRCQFPKKSTRRKACNACVQAKAKCTYTRPCARCVKRGVPCAYASQPSDVPPGLDLDLDLNIDQFHEDVQPTRSPGNGPLSPFHLSPPPLATPGFIDAVQPPAVEPSTQGVPGSADEAMNSSLLLWNLPEMSLPGSEESGPVVQLTLQDLLRVLDQYPNSLLSDSFTSPLLHYSLYDADVPDMTTLARSSMAICCGSAMLTPDGARFARQAMEVERQRLIESYSQYTCMQQWDALHAMLVYSILEMRPSPGSQSKNEWKQKSCSRGLKAPFLAKMAQTFIRSHLKDLSPNLMPFSHTLTPKFEHWAVAETTRRTIFLANIIHYLSNHHPESGLPSLYYEPLNDEFILNMPLPCSHALWAARTEQEWKVTMEYCDNNSSSLVEDFPSVFYLNPGCLTLKILMVNYSKVYLETFLMRNIGFGGSDELRSFIILCALRQFA